MNKRFIGGLLTTLVLLLSGPLAPAASEALAAATPTEEFVGPFAISFGLNAKPLFQRDRLFESSSLHDALPFIRSGYSIGAGALRALSSTGNCPEISYAGHSVRLSTKRRDNKYQVYCRTSMERLRTPYFKAFFVF